MKNFNYSTRIRSEADCEGCFFTGGPFWHLCTPGQSTEVLFRTVEEFIICINLIAAVQRQTNVIILTFAVMSNHLHFILECDEASAQAFFDALKRKLRRWFVSSGRYVKLDEFKCELIRIDNLQSVRNEIVYVNRNGFLANKAYTPFSYPWGAGYLYYGYIPDNGVLFSSLSRRVQESIIHGRTDDIYHDLLVDGEMVMPGSFCDIERGMALFRDGHQYLSRLSKSFEAYSEIAKRIGDTVVLSDEELYSVIRIISKKQYPDMSLTMLPISYKLELAKRLRSQYNASEGQLQRMLRLDRNIVKELFGR